METLILLIVALVIVCACLIGRILVLKHQMKNIRDELELTQEQSYNRQLTVALIDRDLTAMAVQMNKNLDYQKQLKLRSERAERVMKQSVSDIAHDLRTPLTVIKGNLQMMENEDSVSEKGKEYLRICSRKCSDISAMADHFFELSVLESDTAEVRTSQVNATNVLVQFVIDNEAVIRAHALTPDIQLPDKSVFIKADEQLLVRMLGNLLNNVIKYAHEEFIISLSEQNGKGVISFSNKLDAGRQLDVAQLFERTYRGDKARKGGGAGLGLYIVKLLAQKQGAEVKASVDNDVLDISMIFDIAKR